MLLSRMGVTQVTVVPEQEQPDGNFPTCPYPNPEITRAMETGLKLCDTVHPRPDDGTDPTATAWAPPCPTARAATAHHRQRDGRTAV